LIIINANGNGPFQSISAEIHSFNLLTNPSKFDINEANMSYQMFVVYLGAKRGHYNSPTPQ
jgi:hypothetical protein